MFSDEILEKLFALKEIQKLTLAEQSMLIDKIEKILEEVEENQNATLF